MKIKNKLKISMLLLTIVIAGISIAGAFPGQTDACNGSGCHTLSPSIVITANVTSTLTVNPNQVFTVGINYNGGNPAGTTEVNWPTNFTNINLTNISNNLFNPIPRIPVNASSATNGTTSSVLTAPPTPGLYIVRVYTSTGSTVPGGTNFNEINITVQEPEVELSTITISPSTVTLNVNGTQVFNATALDQNNTPVAGVNISWTVSNSTVGNVTPLFAITGLDGIASTTFTALAVGNTTVNATNGTVSGSANITVGVPTEQNLTTISVLPSAATLDVNDTQVFTTTALDQNNIPMSGINISWTISNSTVGNVTPLFAITGLDGIASTTFTALAVGNTTVNATNGTVSGGADVIVTTVEPGAGSISGMKFNDSNSNGIRDTGESGLADWQIILQQPDGSTISMMTDENGSYNFTDLTAGTYTVSETEQAGWVQTFPAAPGTYSITLASGQNVVDKDFGNFKSAVVQLGSISGFKINRANGKGIEGVRISLRGIGPETRKIKQKTRTNDTGFYEFNDLPAGRYIITEKKLKGFVPTSPPVLIVNLEEGENSINNNFMNRPLHIFYKNRFYDFISPRHDINEHRNMDEEDEEDTDEED